MQPAARRAAAYFAKARLCAANALRKTRRVAVTFLRRVLMDAISSPNSQVRIRKRFALHEGTKLLRGVRRALRKEFNQKAKSNRLKDCLEASSEGSGPLRGDILFSRLSPHIVPRLPNIKFASVSFWPDTEHFWRHRISGAAQSSKSGWSFRDIAK